MTLYVGREPACRRQDTVIGFRRFASTMRDWLRLPAAGRCIACAMRKEQIHWVSRQSSAVTGHQTSVSSMAMPCDMDK